MFVCNEEREREEKKIEKLCYLVFKFRDFKSNCVLIDSTGIAQIKEFVNG